MVNKHSARQIIYAKEEFVCLTLLVSPAVQVIVSCLVTILVHALIVLVIVRVRVEYMNLAETSGVQEDHRQTPVAAIKF